MEYKKITLGNSLAGSDTEKTHPKTTVKILSAFVLFEAPEKGKSIDKNPEIIAKTIA